jgi:hypothetical protein
MAKRHLALVTPATVIGTVEPRRPPKRVRSVEVRAREYLTDAEVGRLIWLDADSIGDRPRPRGTALAGPECS